MLEPALGTGAFWSAWLRTARQTGCKGIGIELDSELAAASRRLWSSTGLDVRRGDFTAQTPPDSEDNKADLVISNPPYVRHHHLEREQKIRLREASARASGVRLSGLAGLYCHFLALAHPWMRSGALAAWLVPSEFMDVNYGGPLKRYLLERVTLFRCISSIRRRFNLTMPWYRQPSSSSSTTRLPPSMKSSSPEVAHCWLRRRQYTRRPMLSGTINVGPSLLSQPPKAHR